MLGFVDGETVEVTSVVEEEAEEAILNSFWVTNGDIVVNSDVGKVGGEDTRVVLVVGNVSSLFVTAVVIGISVLDGLDSD